MRVDYSDCFTRPGLIARKYTYSQIENVRDFEIEIHFDIQAGISIFTFATFLISILDLPQETSLRGSLIIMDNSIPPAVMNMRGRPDSGGAVIGLLGQKDHSECLRLFLAGQEMQLEIANDKNEKMIIIPIPNDGNFRRIYNSAYDQMCAADDAQFKNDDGFIGRINRFIRGLAGR